MDVINVTYILNLLAKLKEAENEEQYQYQYKALMQAVERPRAA